MNALQQIYIHDADKRNMTRPGNSAEYVMAERSKYKHKMKQGPAAHSQACPFGFCRQSGFKVQSRKLVLQEGFRSQKDHKW